MSAARLKPMFEEAAKARAAANLKQNQPSPEVANLPPREDIGKSREKAAETLNVSPRSVQSATKVIEKAVPEVAKAVDAGKVSVSDAARLKPMFEEAARQRMLATQNNNAAKAAGANLHQQENIGKSNEKAAEALNVSPRSVQAAAKGRKSKRCWETAMANMLTSRKLRKANFGTIVPKLTKASGRAT
jgi:DNA-binding XRE family transcriptional regulator